ncbi:MAG TPA: YndJ family transporter [Opitutaceae bacterium]|nr:YndJ family transporter [Opitutaceae bacterium]
MTTGTKSVIGAIAWLAFVFAARTSPLGPAWTEVLITFAALVLVPLVLDLVSEHRDTGKLGRATGWAVRAQLPAAAMLALACGLKPGLLALLCAIPWAAVLALLATVGLGRVLRDGWSRPLDRLATDFGLMYALVGAIWVLADRGGLRPLGFDPQVVALTAAHFHFAGMLLPVFAGLVLRQAPDSRFAARAVVGVVLGVPAVAVGITATQLGWTPAIEAAAGCGLALSGIAVGILHVRCAIDAHDVTIVPRVLMGIAGVSLFFAMLLAGSYAVRAFLVPLPWLGLPQMRAIHGTVNALGFGLCGTLGWWRFARRETPLAGAA